MDFGITVAPAADSWKVVKHAEGWALHTPGSTIDAECRSLRGCCSGSPHALSI